MRGACAWVPQDNHWRIIQLLLRDAAAVQQRINQAQQGVQAGHDREEGGALPVAQPVNVRAIAAQQPEPGA